MIMRTPQNNFASGPEKCQAGIRCPSLLAFTIDPHMFVYDKIQWNYICWTIIFKN